MHRHQRAFFFLPSGCSNPKIFTLKQQTSNVFQFQGRREYHRAVYTHQQDTFPQYESPVISLTIQGADTSLLEQNQEGFYYLSRILGP